MSDIETVQTTISPDMAKLQYLILGFTGVQYWGSQGSLVCRRVNVKILVFDVYCSGLLVAYLSLKEMKKRGGAHKFQWGMFYFHIFCTHKGTVARTVMCRQDGRGRCPVLLDDHSKCRTNSQRKSQLS